MLLSKNKAIKKGGKQAASFSKFIK